MANITSLYKDYFQKSKIFLFPVLNIKKGGSVTPIETYTSWTNNYDFDDCKLMCVYHLRNDDEFRMFEKAKLIGNKYFHDFKQIENNNGVYVFDLKSIYHEWRCFIKGKYSKMSVDHKRTICSYIGNTANLPYVQSFLYPENYFKMYSEMINIKESVLREVGELCDPPNVEKETLTISIKDLEFKGEKM